MNENLVNNKSEDIDIAIIIGSKSDLTLAIETVKVLKEFELLYSLNVASAHRSPTYLKECIRNAENLNVKVFIAIAGMSAALPGVIASETIIPVIGVPTNCNNLFGLDALFSIVQMPKHVPVATVSLGIAGAINAAILSVQMIAITDKKLKEKLKEYKYKILKDVIHNDFKLQDKEVRKLKKYCV
jgi:5-(carboxyamino)imidazole ribonucleotide mutase